MSEKGPTPPVEEVNRAENVVDYKGGTVIRSKTGGWKSAWFIIGVEVAERFAYCGIGSNLISYLIKHLRQSTATAATSVNIWSGVAQILPLLGAFVADSYLGRYRTIIFASLIYILGLGLLTVSAVIPSECQVTSCSPPTLEVIFFYFSLYLVAIGQGGHKPCVQAFGADQFDGKNPEECKAKGSFFNWWYFGVSIGVLTVNLLNYVQDNLNWALGFGIPCMVMGLGLLIFLLGTRTYRYAVKMEDQNPFARIGRVFVAAARNRKTTALALADEEEARGALPYQGSHQFKFLNKALVAPDGSKEEAKICGINEVEDAKALLRLFPIWATCLIYATVFSQSSTLFTKQGLTMNRSITSGFDIPAASLQSFISISILLFIPIYDRIIVPIARSITRKPSGITMLQRIGIGMFLSIMSMIIAAFVEMKRLNIAREHGLIDDPIAIVPMAVWWLCPQYILFGVADVFTMVGMQEFFYDQVPNELRSLGLSLYLSILGIGSFISGFLVSAINAATRGDGRYSWFADNLNRGHLDYFYWLLASASALGLAAYLYFAKSYVYNRASTT